jgi:hypothetical protein
LMQSGADEADAALLPAHAVSQQSTARSPPEGVVSPAAPTPIQQNAAKMQSLHGTTIDAGIALGLPAERGCC